MFQIGMGHSIRRGDSSFNSSRLISPTDEQVKEYRTQGIRADKNQGGGKSAASLDQIADRNRRRDRRSVADHVEESAAEAHDFLGRRVGHHRPAERRQTLAEKGNAHDRNDHPVRPT